MYPSLYSSIIVPYLSLMAYEPISMVYKPACFLFSSNTTSGLWNAHKWQTWQLFPTWDHHVCEVFIHSQLSYLLNIGVGQELRHPYFIKYRPVWNPWFPFSLEDTSLCGLGWLCLPIASWITLIVCSKWQVKGYQAQEACYFFLCPG